MYKSSNRLTHSFVVNFFLLNKFNYSNIHQLPSFDKIVLNTFIQDLDVSVSSYYPRSLLLLENLTARKSIIKSIKKTLKGKKAYQVVVSHTVTLRKDFLYNFIIFFVYFFTKGMDEKFIKYNMIISFDGNYYLRIKDVSSLPGMSEDFFKWSYFLDCFFVKNSMSVNNH